MTRSLSRSVPLVFGFVIAVGAATVLISDVTPEFTADSYSSSDLADLLALEHELVNGMRTVPVNEPEIQLDEQLREADLDRMDLPLVRFEQECDPELRLVILQGNFESRGGIAARGKEARPGFLAMAMLNSPDGYTLLRSTFSESGAPFATALGDESLQRADADPIAESAVQRCDAIEVEGEPIED